MRVRWRKSLLLLNCPRLQIHTQTRGRQKSNTRQISYYPTPTLTSHSITRNTHCSLTLATDRASLAPSIFCAGGGPPQQVFEAAMDREVSHRQQRLSSESVINEQFTCAGCFFNAGDEATGDCTLPCRGIVSRLCSHRQTVW